jgi:dTDP-4-amino-4,6-dideoxygalactose transaminase
MLDKISLFQTNRLWNETRAEIFDLVDQYHNQGIAQNGELMLLVESTLAKKFGKKYCITLGCCTDALVVSLLALNLPKNSRVGVSNYTFTATAHAVARAGHQVVPIDIVDNYCINPLLIKNVDAVIPVDIFGNMSDWNKINNLSIPVINDAAQSLESYNGNRFSAAQGLISCISFSPSKTISSWGSGGAILTDDLILAERCRRFRLHGKIKNSDKAIGPGVNSMMSTFELAAVLTGLKYSEIWQKRRQNIAEYLITESNYHHGMDTHIKHTYHKLVFQTHNRNSVIDLFQKNNVDCPVHYTLTVNDEILYQTNNKFPVSDRLKTTSFTVPNQHTLTDIEVERIGKLLK